MTNEKRVCNKCGEERALTEFSRNSSKVAGINTQCKPCGRQYDKRYRATLAGRSIRAFHHSVEKSKKLGRTSTVTAAEVRALFEEAKSCATCGTTLDINDQNALHSLDHIYPISNELGGVNHVFNLVVLCEKCNSRKQSRHIHDFFTESEDFTPELYRAFVSRFTSRLIGREISDAEVDEMTANLAAEAQARKEVKQNARIS